VLRDAKQLIYIHPEASLYEAIKTLIHNKIHRQGGRILVEKINWIESFVLKKKVSNTAPPQVPSHAL
jgi:hypothetical protein